LPSLLESIGIEIPLGPRPKARIKLGSEVDFEDFQVLEVFSEYGNNPIQPRFVNELVTPAGSPAPFVRARLTKRGMSTLAAVRSLSIVTGIPAREIAFAGMKDSPAVTSQLISFPATRLNNILTADLDGQKYWLSTLHYAPAALYPGAHSANHFRIKVWPQERKSFTMDELRFVQERLSRVASLGFPNFFNTQRFERRPMNHFVGAKMVAGQWEEAARALLFYSTARENDRARETRDRAYAEPDLWRKVEVFKRTSSRAYAREIGVLTDLARGESIRTALLKMQQAEVPSFYLQAWTSWKWNQAVSALVRQGRNLPAVFPYLKGIPDERKYERIRVQYVRDTGIAMPDWPDDCYQDTAHIVPRPTAGSASRLRAALDFSHCELEFTLGVNQFATTLLMNAFDNIDQ